MKTLVTGASGLIGANLVRALLTSGHEVRALTRPTSDLRSLRGLPVELVRGDILDPSTLTDATKGCDVVFHAAAVYSYWGYSLEKLRTIAVHGTRNILRSAHSSGVKRVVLTSSSIVLGSSTSRAVRDEASEFDDPDPPAYVQSKVDQDNAAFEIADELNQELVAVYPALTVGPHDYRLSPSNAAIANYLNDPFRSTFPGGCNLVSSLDVASGHVLVAEKGKSGQRYVLASENLEWRAVHKTISELCGTFGPNLTMTYTMSYLAAAAAEMTGRFSGTRPLVTREEAKMTGRYYWYCHERAAALGYSPKPARQAIAEGIAWLVTTPHVSSFVLRKLELAQEVLQAQASLKENLG